MFLETLSRLSDLLRSRLILFKKQLGRLMFNPLESLLVLCGLNPSSSSCDTWVFRCSLLKMDIKEELRFLENEVSVTVMTSPGRVTAFN